MIFVIIAFPFVAVVVVMAMSKRLDDMRELERLRNARRGREPQARRPTGAGRSPGPGVGAQAGRPTDREAGLPTRPSNAGRPVSKPPARTSKPARSKATEARSKGGYKAPRIKRHEGEVGPGFAAAFGAPSAGIPSGQASAAAARAAFQRTGGSSKPQRAEELDLRDGLGPQPPPASSSRRSSSDGRSHGIPGAPGAGKRKRKRKRKQ
jgi:hypothetical protein